MRPQLWILTIVLALVVVAPAVAAPLPTIKSSLEIARKHFPNGECVDRTGPRAMRVIVVHRLLGQLDELDSSGQHPLVRVDGSAWGRAFYSDGTTRLLGCVLAIDDGLLKDRPRMCDVIVHEFHHVSDGALHNEPATGGLMDVVAGEYPPCHRRTRRQQAMDATRVELPKDRRWRVDCDRRGRSCRARSSHTRTRVYHIDEYGFANLAS